jgi:hypothetical protein
MNLNAFVKAELAKAPCPFCGHPEPRVIEHDVGSWCLVCSDCEAFGPAGKSEMEALRKWCLRRTPNANQAAEILKV